MVTSSYCSCGSMICPLRKDDAKGNLFPASLNKSIVMTDSRPAMISSFLNATLDGKSDLKYVCPMLRSFSFNILGSDIK